MKFALMSLSDKEGIIPFAKGLINLDYQLLATGGTARYLQENDLPVTLIETITEFPEILDGRVKTLHPKIFGGILADRDNPEHRRQMKDLMINSLDFVVVNLYPFQKLFAEKMKSIEQSEQISHAEMMENIDIGGVSLLRAAAKNYRQVCVVSEKSDYELLLDELKKNGKVGDETRLFLARKAFATTSAYDRCIYQYLQQIEDEVRPDLSLFPGWQKTELRYGENPHQKAFFYSPGSEGLIEQFHGKQLSYNNYLDINAGLKLISRFDRPAVGIFKHTNPCGVAAADDLLTAYTNSFATDPLSPFGGIVVVNRAPDLLTAKAIDKVFTEIIITPDFPREVKVFLLKKKNRRLIRYHPELMERWAATKTFVSCLDGVLSQDIDLKPEDEAEWQVVTSRVPTKKELESLRFCWKVVAGMKSNAICLGTEERTLGLGMGQTSRIDAAEIAVYRANKYGHVLEGAVCASDGFFPFRDGVDYLADKGIKAIIQPGGSKGDAEVVKACNEHGISMIFTGYRHFAH